MEDTYTDDEAAEIVELLLEAGADINEKQYHYGERTPDILLFSILQNYTKVANKIIEKGFNINGGNGLLLIGVKRIVIMRKQKCLDGKQLSFFF